MADLEKLGIPRERIRLSQAAGYEPLAAPDEQFPGGGYARVEVSLLNETTGHKVAEQGNAKSRSKAAKSEARGRRTPDTRTKPRRTRAHSRQGSTLSVVSSDVVFPQLTTDY